MEWFLDDSKVRDEATKRSGNPCNPKTMFPCYPKFFGLEKGTFAQKFKKGSNIIFDFIPKDHLMVFHGFACSSNKLSNLELKINKKFVKINSGELYEEGFIVGPNDRLFLSGIANEEGIYRVIPWHGFVLFCKEKYRRNLRGINTFNQC